MFIAEGAIIKGNVTIGESSSVWYNSVIRAESESITIGRCTNIQDNCVLHVDFEAPVVIGDYVTVGHGAIVHGCKVGNNTLIGMGATILSYSTIGENCIIGAGALVTEHKTIPAGSLVMGVPGRVVRKLSEREIEEIKENAEMYVREAELQLIDGLYISDDPSFNY